MRNGTKKLHCLGDFLSARVTPQHVWISQALESKILNKHGWNFKMPLVLQAQTQDTAWGVLKGIIQ